MVGATTSRPGANVEARAEDGRWRTGLLSAAADPSSPAEASAPRRAARTALLHS